MRDFGDGDVDFNIWISSSVDSQPFDVADMARSFLSVFLWFVLSVLTRSLPAPSSNLFVFLGAHDPIKDSRGRGRRRTRKEERMDDPWGISVLQAGRSATQSTHRRLLLLRQAGFPSYYSTGHFPRGQSVVQSSPAKTVAGLGCFNALQYSPRGPPQHKKGTQAERADREAEKFVPGENSIDSSIFCCWRHAFLEV